MAGRGRGEGSMRYATFVLLVVGFALIASAIPASAAASGATPSGNFDIATLAGKVASIRATEGFHLRLSSFLESQAGESEEVSAAAPGDPITPTFVLSSPLDGTSVAAPTVTINQDTHAASQNEPAIAVDPNNPNRIVAAANDYVTRTWSCDVGGTPCSGLGDGYSGTYFSNDGGATWCCVASDPRHRGTLIPGVTRLSGGQYDASGDPAVAVD